MTHAHCGAPPRSRGLRVMMAVAVGVLLQLAGCGSASSSPGGEYVFVTEAGTRIESVELAKRLALRWAVNEDQVAWGFQVVHVGRNQYDRLTSMTLSWPGGRTMQLPGSSRLVNAQGDQYAARYMENALFELSEDQVRTLAQLPDEAGVTLTLIASDGRAVDSYDLTTAQMQAVRAFVRKRSGSE